MQSLLDEREFDDLNLKMDHMKDLLNRKEFDNATRYWSFLESVIRQYTFHADFYNVMQHQTQENEKISNMRSAPESELFLYKLGEFYDDVLDELMNTRVRSFLSM